MVTVLMASHQDPVDLWRQSLAMEMPELEFRAYPNIGNPAIKFLVPSRGSMIQR